MQRIRKHWRLSVGLMLLVVVSVSALLRVADARMMFAAAMLQGEPQPTYTPVTQFEYDQVKKLLAESSLDREALIALNLSAQQAESVLDTVRDWRSENASTLGTLEDTVHQKTTAVYLLEKSIRSGPFNENNETALAAARSELAEAKSAYHTALSSLKTSVNNILTESQRATWTAIQSGHGQQMPIRMLALTDTQRLSVSDAWHRYRRQHAAAATQEERSAAVTTWQASLDQVLTTEQKNVVSSFNSNYNTASAAVNGAFTLVLATSEQS